MISHLQLIETFLHILMLHHTNKKLFKKRNAGFIKSMFNTRLKVAIFKRCFNVTNETRIFYFTEFNYLCITFYQCGVAKTIQTSENLCMELKNAKLI